MIDTELEKVQQYLRKLFANDDINLRDRAQADGSVEVSVGEEFIGVIFKDDEEGDVSYDFRMSILEIDLPE